MDATVPSTMSGDSVTFEFGPAVRGDDGIEFQCSSGSLLSGTTLLTVFCELGHNYVPGICSMEKKF